METNLKILIITDQYNERTAAGTGVYAYELSKALAKSGTEVHVIAPGLKTYSTKLEDKLFIHYYKTIFKHFIRMPLYSFQVWKNWKQILTDNDISIVLSNNNAGVWVNRKIKLITVIQHPAMKEMANLRGIQKILNSIDILLEKIIVRKSVKLIVTSKSTEESLKKLYPKASGKIIYLPIGVDFNKYNNTNVIENDPITILFPGGARMKRKGAEYLFPALNKLSNKHNFKVIVTGNSREIGWEKEYLDLMIKNDLSSKILNVGEVSYDDMANLFSIADIVVFPSIYEGYGIPILEAMAMSKPIIATKTGIATEVIKDRNNGLLIDCRDESQIYVALDMLIENKTLRFKLRDSARKSIMEVFSWSCIATKLIRICQSII